MKNRFHEFRYIMHLKHYDEGVFFFREVLGLQPNYNWAIVPDNKGYRFYMGSGRIEIVQYPFVPVQGRGEFAAECRNLRLCRERIFEEMPDVKKIREGGDFLVLEDDNGNVMTLTQGEGDLSVSGPVEKTNMFTGGFTGILYEDDLTEAETFYRDLIGLPVLSGDASEGRIVLSAGNARLELRPRETEAASAMGPSMIGLEAYSVNQIYDRLSVDGRYREAGPLRDTDFDARRLFQIYDPGGNVVELYAYLKNVREEILLH